MLMNQPRVPYEDVILMRALKIYNPSVFSGSRLSKMFDVSRGHAQKIVRGAVWKEISFPSEEDAWVIARAYLDGRFSD